MATHTSCQFSSTSLLCYWIFAHLTAQLKELVKCLAVFQWMQDHVRTVDSP